MMDNVASMLNNLNLVQGNSNSTSIGKSSTKESRTSDFQSVLNGQMKADATEEVIEEVVVPFIWQNVAIMSTNEIPQNEEVSLENADMHILPAEEFIEEEVINKLVEIGFSEENVEATLQEMNISKLDLFNQDIFDEFSTQLKVNSEEHMTSARDSESETGDIPIAELTEDSLDVEMAMIWKGISHQKEIMSSAQNNEQMAEMTQQLISHENQVSKSTDLNSEIDLNEQMLSEEVPTILNGNEITPPIIEVVKSELAEKENEMAYLETFEEFKGPQIQKQLSMNIYKQMIEKIEISKLMEKQEITMQLHPKELGKMSIKIVEENGKYIAAVKLDNQRTKDLVMGNIAELKSNLEQQGLVIEQFSIDINKDEQNSLMEQGRKKSSKRINDIISSILTKLDEEREQISNQLEVDITI